MLPPADARARVAEYMQSPQTLQPQFAIVGRMSMQGDFWWRTAWRQVLAWMLLIAVLTPLFWVSGLLSSAAVPAFIGGSIFAAVVCIVAAGLQSRRHDAALSEVHSVLLHVERGQFDQTLSSPCHSTIPEVASVVERAQVAVRSEIASLVHDRDRLQNVINSMAEGVISVDSEQRILLMNARAMEFFALGDKAALGRPVWEQVRSPQLQSWVATAIDKAVPSGGELHHRSAIGRDLALTVSAFQGRRKTGAVIVVTDVTELRRLERVRQQFVANASHELKTPITSIQACIETLIDGAIDDPPCRDRFLQTICEQTERLDALVKDLLTLARLEAEPLNREPRPIWVQSLIRICCDRHRQTAERKRLALTLQAIDPDIQIMAEEEALEHILDNLIDNALKYTEPGGRVTLALRIEEGAAYIDVSDTGIGIPQHHLPRIFERFYRVDRHRSRDVGGTGLGLSIVKHLVQAIGGSISVTSRQNEGSTFSVKFPLAAN